jgi:hypothetical protein
MATAENMIDLYNRDLDNPEEQSNARDRLGLSSEKFLHIGGYRIKVELDLFLDIQI